LGETPITGDFEVFGSKLRCFSPWFGMKTACFLLKKGVGGANFVCNSNIMLEMRGFLGHVNVAFIAFLGAFLHRFVRGLAGCVCSGFWRWFGIGFRAGFGLA